MRPLVYCQACGERLDDPDHEGGARCPGCDRVWYSNMAPTAGAAVVKDGKALVTVRAFDPEKGKHDVPGGFLREGEDPVTGLKREVREELGIEIDVSLDDLVQVVPHPYGDDGQWVLSAGFIARLVSGEPTPADDVAEVHWFTASDLEGADFAWEHDRDLIRRALRDGSAG
jgi:8-oxo-dGTP diphosphatase